MKLTYFEHYPHYLGTLNSTATVDSDVLMTLAALTESPPADPMDDIIQEIDGQYEDEGLIKMEKGSTVYAFDCLLSGDYREGKAIGKYWNSIWKSLDEKGYWIGQWEEGSYGLALEGFEKECINAIARMEAKIAEDSFCW